MIWKILRHWISSVVWFSWFACHMIWKILRHWIFSVVICVPHDLENSTTLDFQCRELCATWSGKLYDTGFPVSWFACHMIWKIVRHWKSSVVQFCCLSVTWRASHCIACHMIWKILRHWKSSVMICVPHSLENSTTLDFQCRELCATWSGNSTTQISHVVVCVPHDLENSTTLDFQCRMI